MTKTKAKKNKPAARLPSKPSALIRVALADLAKCELSSKYEIRMGTWHEPDIDCTLPCEVCLAGSVIAKSLNADPARHIRPEDFPGSVCQKLNALDEFRKGDIVSGLAEMYIASPYGLALDVDVSEYDSEGPGPFKRDMRKMADLLERFGL